MDKRALMIAPSYDALSEEGRLTALKADVDDMIKTLVHKCGFVEDNFKVLQGNEATKENILKALGELTSSCQPGSVVLVYYSGHGAYLPDSQDEGLFPTVLTWPTDRPLEELCITGQDLRPLFEQFSKKQVRCTVIFDCCHSGHLYRDANQLIGFKIKQFVPKSTEDKSEMVHKQHTKVDRGGFAPKDNDYFFYFAACSPVQKALEIVDQGGMLTMAVVNTLKSLKSPDKVSYEVFFRLLMKEFKEKEWDSYQTPEFERGNSNTVLFGVSEAKQPEGGIAVIEVPNEEEVLLDAGVLQNLLAGKYSVYSATASSESVMQGTSSNDWLAFLDVPENFIDKSTAIGCVSEPRGQITIGCLAYLDEPGTINFNVLVLPNEAHDKVESLVNKLKRTGMLNVLMNQPKTNDPDLITIACETVESKTKWVARIRGKIFIPPISIDVNNADDIMTKNLCKHIRYLWILEMAKSPDDKQEQLENVTLKLFKVEKMKYGPSSKQTAIAEGLENGLEVTKVTDRTVFFKANKDSRGKAISGSGDSFIYQVINDNKTVEEIVHICIILYQSDGSIVPLYPPRKGGTTELRGGDTVEDILPLIVPKDVLRSMAEPDPSKEEPDYSRDTLVLYASSKAANYGPILQSHIQTEPKELLKSLNGRGADPLSDLDKILKLKKRPIPTDEVEEKTKYFIKKVQILTKKFVP